MNIVFTIEEAPGLARPGVDVPPLKGDKMIDKRTFLSFSSADKVQADLLELRLRAEGLDVFFAPRDVEMGESWLEKIREAVERADVFVVLISKASNGSKWVRKEVDLALKRHHEGKLKFIPIVIEDGVEPPEPIRNRKIQHHKIAVGDSQEWDRVAAAIGRKVQTKSHVLVAAALSIISILTILLEAWASGLFYYLPLVLLLTVATITFAWFNMQTRSKRLSLILFIPLAIQLTSVGVNLGDLRRNEIEQAKTNAFAICNAANESAFDFLWDKFAASRHHRDFVAGLREVLDDRALSLSSRTNARVALTRLGEYRPVTDRFDPSDNTSLFEFARKPDRWLRGSTQLEWVLSWLENKRDPRVVIWAARTLGLASEIIERPPFSPADVSNVQDRLLNLVATTDNAGVYNNSLWALGRLKTGRDAVAQAEGKSAEANRLSTKHLGLRRLGDLGINLVLIDPPQRPADRQPFYISDTEITFEQFSRFIKESPGYKTSADLRGNSSCFGHDGIIGSWHPCDGATWHNPVLPDKMPPSAQSPAMHVSWIDAVHFCNWLSRIEGLTPAYEVGPDAVWKLVTSSTGYRLPRVDEWRTASQAGTSTPFWWADFAEWQVDRNWKCLVANLPDSSFMKWKEVNAIAGNDEKSFHALVKTFTPNDYGLFDTIGNVAEWCDDDNTNGKKPRLGGSWGDNLQDLIVSVRRDEGADTSHVNVGFRIARNVQHVQD